VAAYLLGAGQAFLLVGVLAGNILVAWRRWRVGHGRPAADRQAPIPTRSSHDLH
jgi:hypothetical protein